MNEHNPERMHVDELLEIPEAGTALRHQKIDAANNHLSLVNAASVVSASTDELLAVMEYRLRHRARTTNRTPKKTKEVGMFA